MKKKGLTNMITNHISLVIGVLQYKWTT